MMNIKILIIAFLISCGAYSQETIVPLENLLGYESEQNEVVYFKDVNNLLNKYTGNWIYDDGTHYLKITVTKKEHLPQDFFGKLLNPNYEDNLSIKMIYKLNGVEQYNTTSFGATTALINGNVIESTNKISLEYYEPTSSCRRQKHANLTLEFNPSNTLGGNGTLGWTRTSRISYVSPNTECPDGTLVDSSDFIIPANLVLSRE
ncbi:DUF6705 family protein [uncultured Psychroserpens sp.]|uniref:DUF6705 family protein n=1 Tax=uncultured Psychroserpens sp. TaxID=255436 RepID=UPI00260D85F1|nr:DUF6705 family protein [uncultured Psychroserpens sp.]